MTRSLDQWLETAVGGRWAFIGLGIVLILGGVGGSLYESLRSAEERASRLVGLLEPARQLHRRFNDVFRKSHRLQQLQAVVICRDP